MYAIVSSYECPASPLNATVMFDKQHGLKCQQSSSVLPVGFQFCITNNHSYTSCRSQLQFFAFIDGIKSRLVYPYVTVSDTSTTKTKPKDKIDPRKNNENQLHTMSKTARKFPGKSSFLAYGYKFKRGKRIRMFTDSSQGVFFMENNSWVGLFQMNVAV